MKTFNLEDLSDAIHDDSDKTSVLTDTIWSTVCDGDAVKIGNDLFCASNIVQLIMDGSNEGLKSELQAELGRSFQLNNELFEKLREMANDEAIKHVKGGE